MFRISLTAEGVTFTPFPNLPKPCANLSGTLLGRTLFVVGGIETPDAKMAMNSVWSLDLDSLDQGWYQHEACPGPGRMLAAVGALDDSLFVFSGAALKAGPDGKPLREWLQDGYRFTPKLGWKPVQGPPQISVAAPNPMPSVSSGQLLLLGGDDGAQVASTPDDHKGFPKTVLAYDPNTNSWKPAGTLPVGLVTTSAVLWRDLLIIPGGEIRPGTRSTQIWAAPFPASQESSTPGQNNGAP